MMKINGKLSNVLDVQPKSTYKSIVALNVLQSLICQ